MSVYDGWKTEKLETAISLMTAELDRRRTINTYAAVADYQLKELQAAAGVKRGAGDPWVKPTPGEPATLYTIGDRVTGEDDAEWVSLIPNNSYPPGTEGAWQPA